MRDIKKIAILNGWGDAHGMNAAIKGVLRSGLNEAFFLIIASEGICLHIRLLLISLKTNYIFKCNRPHS